MRATAAQKLSHLRWATKITAGTVAAGSVIKWTADSGQDASRISNSTLNDAAERLKKTEVSDSFGKNPDNADLKSPPSSPPKATRH